MALPSPSTMAAAAPKAASSSFLTGPVQYGLAAGAASAIPQVFGSGSVNFRGKYARKQLKHDISAQTQKFAAHIDSIKKAGLHPLAALGIAPGAGGGPQPGIPGQSELGGAVEKGISTALNAATVQQAQRASLEEQQLRNDWLKQQMRHSEIKLAAQLANYRRPGALGPATAGTPGPGPTQPGTLNLSEHIKLPTGTTTSSQDAEDRWWEIGGAAQGLFNLGYDTAGWLLPKDFGTGRQWRGDNVPNDYATGQPIKRSSNIVRKPYRRPKYPTYRRKSYGKGRYIKQ